MWTQHWPLGELQSTDKDTGKLISENGGTHPLSSTAVLYLSRATGGRGLKSVEREYKLIRSKRLRSSMRIQTQWLEVCGYLKRKYARRDSPHLRKTRIRLRRNWGLVWIWPLPIHRVDRSRPPIRGSVDSSWDNILRKLRKRSLRRERKTRDGKDVYCGPDGKTTSWVHTAVSPGWVDGRALLLIPSQGL